VSRKRDYRSFKEGGVMQLPVIDAQARHEPRRHYDSSMIMHATAPAAADAMLEFGRFRVLLRRRQLLADGVPVELGTRAFDLLMILIEADGRLVTKDELLDRVWPTTVVDMSNLKVQIAALRKALGDDGASIQTDFGRGYRFTAVVRSTTRHRHAGCPLGTRRQLRAERIPGSPGGRARPAPCG
jgi:DNA-binding winged helix-turn-helix (wHTH) protein